VEHPGRFTLRVDGRAVQPRNFSLSGLSFRDRQGAALEEGGTVLRRWLPTERSNGRWA
jgi:hypothetical protein